MSHNQEINHGKRKTDKPDGIVHKFNRVSNSVLAVWGFVVFIITSTISGYTWYNQMLDSIDENTKQIEVTQMMILKDIVRKSENNPCPVSDPEWVDYTKNYTKLFDLKIKYGELHKNALWKPIERITERTELCKR